MEDEGGEEESKMYVWSNCFQHIKEQKLEPCCITYLPKSRWVLINEYSKTMGGWAATYWIWFVYFTSNSILKVAKLARC